MFIRSRDVFHPVSERWDLGKGWKKMFITQISSWKPIKTGFKSASTFSRPGKANKEVFWYGFTLFPELHYTVDVSCCIYYFSWVT